MEVVVQVVEAKDLVVEVALMVKVQEETAEVTMVPLKSSHNLKVSVKHLEMLCTHLGMQSSQRGSIKLLTRY